MDLGGHEGVDISLPMSSSFMPHLHEAAAAKVKVLTTGGNGLTGSSSNGQHSMEEPVRLAPPMDLKVRKPVKYRECQKNHAANLGGHATDGCGEFMPSGEEGTLEALRCAACDCHRNFHRREVEGEASCDCHYGPRDRKRIGPLFPPPHIPLALPPPGLMQPRPSSQMIMAFNPPLPDSDDFDVGLVSPASSLKKRFRTKFTAEQKEQMSVFAEKLGWRMQKQDEAAVQQFCAEVGVKRPVLKVWMHNNKNALRGKTPSL